VALQVQEVLAADLADLLELVVAQPDAALAEAVDVVERGAQVDAGPLVPQRAVRGAEVVHAPEGRRLVG
jgi:hypothetical protein